MQMFSHRYDDYGEFSVHARRSLSSTAATHSDIAASLEEKKTPEVVMSGSVLSARVPYKSAPNTFISERFQAWQNVVRELVAHFQGISHAESLHNKELVKLSGSVPNPFSTYDLFSENSSVQGLGKLLSQQMSGRVEHSNNIIDAIDSDIVPELKDTDKLLTEKIREINNMSSDFKNDLDSGLDTSRASLLALQAAITDWEANSGTVAHDADPFIVDLATRKNLRSSLGEEEYLHESTVNLTASSEELEGRVVNAIRRALAKYNNYVSQEAADLAAMSQTIEESIVAGRLDAEWNIFLKQKINQGLLLDPHSRPRTLESLAYTGKDHVCTSPICDGWLEKKSKVLPTYATAFYIISPSRYLHEFRSNDLRVDNVPSFSLYLPDCELGLTSKEDDAVHKFVIKGKQAGPGLHSEHNWTFRAKTRQDMLAWYSNIGRAADTSFTFNMASLNAPLATNARVPVIPLEADDNDTAPFRGPETLVASPPTARRPATGRFDSAHGFATPLGAVAAGLQAGPVEILNQPTSKSDSAQVSVADIDRPDSRGVLAQSPISRADEAQLTPGSRTITRKDSEGGREATTSYGAMEQSLASPTAYPEHDEHLRQAHIHSSAAGFMNKEMLDANAYLEYDAAHGTHSTLVGDEHFKPANADVPISRSSSVTGNGYRPRRSSSLAFKELPGSSPATSTSAVRRARPAGKIPSRKPTATYGDLNNLPLPSMSELKEQKTPEPISETYRSPYFPAPGAGTTGALPASHFSSEPLQNDSVHVMSPQRISQAVSGTNTPTLPGQIRAPQRKMSLSDQIMFSGQTSGLSSTLGLNESKDVVHADLEPNAQLAMGTHEDTSSPYPAAQRFRVPRSRQASLLAPAHDAPEPIEAYDVAPHMRVGTQSNEARFKMTSRRGSRSASGVATPSEHTPFDRSALDFLSSDNLAAKFSEPSSGEKARARRTPSRGTSINLEDGQSSPVPAFNINQKHTFRKPPSRGSSLSLGAATGNGQEGSAAGMLNTISETFEKDLAAAKGNQPGDTHTPGDFPQTPGVGVQNTLA